MNNKGSTLDSFQTPDFLFQDLHNKFNFNMDAACESHNKKLKNGFTIDTGIDGLSCPWTGLRVFCNPPFSGKEYWIMKAHQAVQFENCYLVVMILPTNSMSSAIWDEIIYPNYKFDILKGRISFINPKTGKPQSGNNSGSTLVYFWKKPSNKDTK